MAEIAIASPMLPLKLILSGSISEHRAFLDAAGYRGGLELHAMRFTKLTREIAQRAMASDIDDNASFIGSAHQSYISRESEMIPHGNPSELARAMAAIALFPSAEQSLGAISKQQRGVRRDQGLPVVVYPEIRRPSGFADLPFSEKLFQPNVRVLEAWDVRTTADMAIRAKEEGLTGVAWDGYHYLRTARSGLQMPDWHEALSSFLEPTSYMPVKEAHVSIGRTDRTEDGSLMNSTRSELGIFLGEPSRISETTTGQMLQTIHGASNGDMRYVVEAQFSRGDMPTGMAPHEAYAALAGNLATFLDSGS